MTALALGTVLIGMVLGIRFRVLILLPAILVAVTAVAVIAMVEGTSAGHAVLWSVIVTCLLQLGYICTALLATSVFRDVDEAQRSQPTRTQSLVSRSHAPGRRMKPS
ncbi:hypothetical protein EAS54_32350 [Bradyrhizobium guangzhouense]|nr:hypothetical protein EAS54_32350 [Bradyrhizobium guangzhouense]